MKSNLKVFLLDKKVFFFDKKALLSGKNPKHQY